MPLPEDSDEDEAAAAGAAAAVRNPAGIRAEMAATERNMFEYFINRSERLERTTPGRSPGETKTEDEPVTNANTAIDKEKYAKDNDVKTSPSLLFQKQYVLLQQKALPHNWMCLQRYVAYMDLLQDLLFRFRLNNVGVMTFL